MEEKKKVRPVTDMFEEYAKTRSIKLRNELILHYLNAAERLSLKYAKMYQLDEDEAIDTGYEALIKAIENYKIDHISEPYRYIDSYIARSIAIRTNVNPKIKLRVYLAFQKYKKELERELSKSYDDDPEMLEIILDRMEADGIIKASPSVRAFYRNQLGPKLSTTQIKGTKLDVDSDECLEENLDNEILIDRLYNVLDMLNDEEKTVITLRFGLEDGTPKTLVEIAKILNIKTERVRKLESRAIREIRKFIHSSETTELSNKRKI